MTNQPHRSLVISNNQPWVLQLGGALLRSGYDVVATQRGAEALLFVRRQYFHLLVIDDTVADLGPLELSLNLRDLAGSGPRIWVAGRHLNRYQSVWRHCDAELVGPPETILAQLPDALGSQFLPSSASQQR